MMDFFYDKITAAEATTVLEDRKEMYQLYDKKFFHRERDYFEMDRLIKIKVMEPVREGRFSKPFYQNHIAWLATQNWVFHLEKHQSYVHVIPSRVRNGDIDYDVISYCSTRQGCLYYMYDRKRIICFTSHFFDRYCERKLVTPMGRIQTMFTFYEETICDPIVTVAVKGFRARLITQYGIGLGLWDKLDNKEFLFLSTYVPNEMLTETQCDFIGNLAENLTKLKKEEHESTRQRQHGSDDTLQ